MQVSCSDPAQLYGQGYQLAAWSTDVAPSTVILPDDTSSTHVAMTSFMTSKPCDDARVAVSGDFKVDPADCSSHLPDSNSVDLIRHVIVSRE